MALRRDKVAYDGKHYTLPLPDGPGKALRLIVHPVRDYIPIYLAAIGPKNLELLGEIADGWLAIFFSPEHAASQLAPIKAGVEKSGRTLDAIDVVPSVPLALGDDLEALADPLRGYAALYIGGMGSREQNFYNAHARRMGYDEEASKIQDLYLAGDKVAAMNEVPFDFVDKTSLLGPMERIADRMQAYAESGVTTLSITPAAGTVEERLVALRTAAEALDKSGVGS
jgi:alkanesulfonate monooxygenase SsuD/methylene tetrahydromethanopterin reductase-like flavin-dependent oxidoreductase (luciferase family)